MQNDTATVPAEGQASELLTEGAVRNKIKHMVVDLLNTGMRGGVYTTRMIMPTHTFEQLHMTEHEKMRLIMQCDEYFKVDTDASALGIIRISDLIDKITGLLKDQNRLAVEEQPAETQAAEAGV